ncbi:MAG: alpha/beta fold hydrolase [Nitrospinota bacterium]|jgi:pimeloyl-[acyl-carrier protein] methyl ester esterase|nr:alpha/beta fold hydrolase [Nitrospinota bacterium]HJP18201.1 alpha/beta fold hydrolase [Nitrospinota bacterium]
MTKKQSTLLFIHGWATDKRVWTEQINELKNVYRCCNINLPGHGGNEKWDKPDLEPPVKEVLNHFLSSKADGSSHDEVTGIGWSLGAQVLLTSAIENKIKFNGLILIGATPCFVKKDDFPWAQPIPVVKKMIKDMKKKPHETIKRFYRLNFTENEIRTEIAKSFINQYTHNETNFKLNEITTGLEALSKIDLRHQLDLLDIPVLIIHSRMDQICPVGASHYLENKIKRAELKIFEKAGHAPFLTETEKFNKLVKGFINKL